MNSIRKDIGRLGRLLLLLIAPFFLAGCHSFNRQWAKMAKQPAPMDAMQGLWQGAWASQVTGHTDQLRCIITKAGDGIYRARFHAKYRKVLSFGYTVEMKAEASNGVMTFSGEANLHWWAGGVYHYEGHSNGTNFDCAYRCKYDHGTFEMTRFNPDSNASH